MIPPFACFGAGISAACSSPSRKFFQRMSTAGDSAGFLRMKGWLDWGFFAEEDLLWRAGWGLDMGGGRFGAAEIRPLEDDVGEE